VRKFLQVLTIWVFCAVVCAQGAEPSAKRGSNAAPALEAAAAQATGLGADQVKACQKLYLNKCMRCHKSYEPSGYSQTEWESWMRKMRKKAHLTPAQNEMITRYLDACRTSLPVTKAKVPDCTSSSPQPER
jgi:cytochrome c5